MAEVAGLASGIEGFAERAAAVGDSSYGLEDFQIVLVGCCYIISLLETTSQRWNVGFKHEAKQVTALLMCGMPRYS
jgi:hypothetical protein